jgi:hypothetical protein
MVYIFKVRRINISYTHQFTIGAVAIAATSKVIVTSAPCSYINNVIPSDIQLVALSESYQRSSGSPTYVILLLSNQYVSSWIFLELLQWKSSGTGADVPEPKKLS